MVYAGIECRSIEEADRVRMALVIDGAFSENLHPHLPNPESRLKVLAAGVDIGCAIGAFERDQLVAVAGLRTADASVFDGMTFSLLRREMGTGAIRARLVLKLLDSSVEPDTIRIEFLAVDEAARGRGVGSMLLEAVANRGCQLGAKRAVLDVDSTNTVARELYRREGYLGRIGGKRPIPGRWLHARSIAMEKELQCTTC